MALNPNESVAILFGTSQRLKSLSGFQSVNVAGAVIPLSDKVKILCATLDANLTMAPYIKALSSSCFIISVLLGKFVHRLMTPWLSLSHQHLFLHAWIR